VPIKSAINVADRPYFRRSIQTRDFAVGEFLIGRVTGKPALTVSYPSVDGRGVLRAVVFASLDVDRLNHLATDARLPPGSALTLLDAKATILARHPDGAKWSGRALLEAPIVQALRARPAEASVESLGVDGVPRLYSIARLPTGAQSGDVYISIGIPREVVFAEPNRLLARNLAGFGIVAVLALAGAWIAGEWLVLRRVRALRDATRRIASGDLRARTELAQGGAELGQLARAFDEMAESLEQREAQRQAAADELDRQREARAQSEKIATMGTWLAGVAHELNNPLAVLVGH